MPRSWPAIAIPNTDTRIKAPSLKEHERIASEAPSFRLPDDVPEEVMAARDMMMALEDEGHRLGQGEKYEIYRYNQGLAARLPSGYTVYLPFEEREASEAEEGSPPP